MARNRHEEERDILWLYLSEHFRELVGIDDASPMEGRPLDSSLVDELARDIQAGKDAAVVYRRLYTYLRVVWGQRKSDDDLRALIESHMGNMKKVVSNAHSITLEARARARGDLSDDIVLIRTFDAKREMVRRYVGS